MEGTPLHGESCKLETAQCIRATKARLTSLTRHSHCCTDCWQVTAYTMGLGGGVSKMLRCLLIEGHCSGERSCSGASLVAAESSPSAAASSPGSVSAELAFAGLRMTGLLKGLRVGNLFRALQERVGFQLPKPPASRQAEKCNLHAFSEYGVPLELANGAVRDKVATSSKVNCRQNECGCPSCSPQDPKP